MGFEEGGPIPQGGRSHGGSYWGAADGVGASWGSSHRLTHLRLFAYYIIIFVLFITFPHYVLAPDVCYDLSYYPAVGRLKATATGFTAFLTGKYPGGQIAFHRTEGWKVLVHPNEAVLSPHERDMAPFMAPPMDCSWEIPVRFTLKEFQKFFPFKPAGLTSEACGCVEEGDFVWFGICHYDGEGFGGIGGVGRYNKRTRRVEIRKPRALIPWSVAPILREGNNLWVGTLGVHECLGHPPGIGLVRYDWKTGETEVFSGDRPGPIGFLILDLLLDGHDLWVATDLGLSRLDLRTLQWRHFVPDFSSSAGIVEKSPEDVYKYLFQTFPREEAYYRIRFQQFVSLLAEHKRPFFEAYLRERPSVLSDCNIISSIAISMFQDMPFLIPHVLPCSWWILYWALYDRACRHDGRLDQGGKALMEAFIRQGRPPEDGEVWLRMIQLAERSLPPKDCVHVLATMRKHMNPSPKVDAQIKAAIRKCGRSSRLDC